MTFYPHHRAICWFWFSNKGSRDLGSQLNSWSLDGFAFSRTIPRDKKKSLLCNCISFYFVQTLYTMCLKFIYSVERGSSAENTYWSFRRTWLLHQNWSSSPVFSWETKLDGDVDPCCLSKWPTVNFRCLGDNNLVISGRSRCFLSIYSLLYSIFGPQHKYSELMSAAAGVFVS